MRVIEQTDEADPDQRALTIGGKRFVQIPARMRPARHFDDARLVAIQLVVNARGIRDHVAGYAQSPSFALAGFCHFFFVRLYPCTVSSFVCPV